MYKLLLTIAVLVVATYCLPASSVDRNVEDPLKLQEKLTGTALRPKRRVCVGVLNLCSEDSEGSQNMTRQILADGQQSLEKVLDLYNKLAARYVNQGNTVQQIPPRVSNVPRDENLSVVRMGVSSIQEPQIQQSHY